MGMLLLGSSMGRQMVGFWQQQEGAGSSELLVSPAAAAPGEKALSVALRLRRLGSENNEKEGQDGELRHLLPYENILF